MRKLRLGAPVLLALALLTAATAAAKPWDVSRIAGPGAAVSRGVDVLPNGHTALLLQRRARGQSRLELRVGRNTRLLDTAANDFLSADVRHDARGRVVVVWRRVVNGVIQAFAWTQRGARQQVSAERQSVSHLALAVARNGRVAFAYSAPAGVFLARGASGAGLGAPTAIAPGTPSALPGVAVSSGERVVLAWSDGRRILVRSARRGVLGGTFVVNLRPAAGQNTLAVGAPKVAMTSGGRAVVVVSSAELRGSPPMPEQNPVVADRRVEAFEWPGAAGRPGGVSTLSRGASAGEADVVAYGETAAIGWTQRPQGAPRSLWVAKWTPRGLQRPNVYDTRMLDSPVLLASAARGALHLFYSTAQRWFNVRLTAAGLYRGTSTVTPPGVQVPAIDAAGEGRHAAAAWTLRDRTSFVQLARP